MSVKKRFSINKDLANGIRNTVQAVSNNLAQIHFDLMSIDIIETDPNNPRQLALTKQDLLVGLLKSDPELIVKQKELDNLTELAESIKKIGVRNAIEVYKYGEKYRLISGERRLLASILAQQTHIPARISQKPDEFKLRYMQWVENINREDLSLFDKYNNLIVIANAYKLQNSQEITPSVLQNLLGTSTAQAYRYHSLMTATPDLIELIKLNKISNLKIIDELSRVKDANRRNDIIEIMKSSSEDVTSLNSFNRIREVVKPTKRKEISSVKKPSHVFPKLSNLSLAKELFYILLQDSRLVRHQANFSNIKWNDAKSVSDAFENIFALLEKEIA